MEKILVVDDEKNIRELLKIKFEAGGFRCLTAENGKEAIEIAKYRQPSLIILDLIMPVMGGFEAYKALKADPSTKNIPIIAYTAQNADVVAEKGLEALDIVDFVLKPFDTKVLMMAVDKALGREQK